MKVNGFQYWFGSPLNFITWTNRVEIFFETLSDTFSVLHTSCNVDDHKRISPEW